ncbi:hypothetical protein B1207_07690 [Legionella quinlivanii]|uniref:Uncharacterized protein n=1 Tax=Legionella quinlivanii TaxID=45073 RepID=A0A364LJJ7_9GAMM|nr:hypothetical protein [Legionella quinlivanii]RAP36676.1 hypothetical protein B1207_07690 [Legionella quinlivanii]
MKRFFFTAPTADNPEDAKKNAEEFLEKSNETNKQALEFLEKNPGASVQTSARFTGMSVKLFKTPEELKKFIEEASKSSSTPTNS